MTDNDLLHWGNVYKYCLVSFPKVFPACREHLESFVSFVLQLEVCGMVTSQLLLLLPWRARLKARHLCSLQRGTAVRGSGYLGANGLKLL